MSHEPSFRFESSARRQGILILTGTTVFSAALCGALLLARNRLDVPLPAVAIGLTILGGIYLLFVWLIRRGGRWRVHLDSEQFHFDCPDPLLGESFEIRTTDIQAIVHRSSSQRGILDSNVTQTDIFLRLRSGQVHFLCQSGPISVPRILQTLRQL